MADDDGIYHHAFDSDAATTGTRAAPRERVNRRRC